MTDSSYSWFYKDPFHAVFRALTTTFSVVSNGLLLYVILTTSSSNIGNYRYLLAVFAICDMMATFGHTFFQPIMHLTTTGFYFFPRHGKNVIAGYPCDTLFAQMFIATYYQTFLILAYHFVYRYKALARGIISSFTNKWRPMRWILTGVIVYILYVAGFVGVCRFAFMPSPETRWLAPPEILEIYGADLHDHERGFTVIAIRRPDNATGELLWDSPSVVAILIAMVMFGGTAGGIVYCIARINYLIRSSNTHLTAKTRKVQRDLFKALLIQARRHLLRQFNSVTAIPMLFSYLPLATVLVFPIVTGVSLGAFGNVLFTTTSIFPSIDAFFVLFFIVQFRASVIRMFRLPFRGPKVSTGTEPANSRTTS